MKNIVLIFLSLFILAFACEEPKDEPIKGETYDHNITKDSDEDLLLNSSIGYFKSQDFNIKAVKEQKIINLKDGVSFYFISVVDTAGKNYAIAVQFAGKYNDKERNFDNVLVITCKNDGLCTECTLVAQGDCGVFGCGCSDKSEDGLFDCNMYYDEIPNFQYNYSTGAKLLNTIKVAKLEVANCMNS